MSSSGTSSGGNKTNFYARGQRKRKREKAQLKLLRSTCSVVRASRAAGQPNLTSVVAAQNYANTSNQMTLFGGEATTVSEASDDCPRVPLLNSPQLQLRFLNPADVPEVKSLCAQWFPIEYPDSWYADITASDDRFYSVCAVYGGRIIGLIVSEIKQVKSLPKEDSEILAPAFRNAKIGYILSLGVVKEFRKNGVASFLLDNLVAYLTGGGGPHDEPQSSVNDISGLTLEVKALYLHVLTTNFGAISFYETRGFRPHLFLPHYYLIQGRRKDGFTYVLYLNGGHPTWTVADYLGHCARTLVWSISMLNPWFLTKALVRKVVSPNNGFLIPAWRRLRQVAHSTVATVFS